MAVRPFIVAPKNDAESLDIVGEQVSVSLVAFWHQPRAPQRPRAGCATRLSARSSGSELKCNSLTLTSG